MSSSSFGATWSDTVSGGRFAVACWIDAMSASSASSTLRAEEPYVVSAVLIGGGADSMSGVVAPWWKVPCESGSGITLRPLRWASTAVASLRVVTPRGTRMLGISFSKASAIWKRYTGALSMSIVVGRACVDDAVAGGDCGAVVGGFGAGFFGPPIVTVSYSARASLSFASRSLRASRSLLAVLPSDETTSSTGTKAPLPLPLTAFGGGFGGMGGWIGWV
jgi:hypothetical protein